MKPGDYASYKAVDIAREMVRLSIVNDLWITNLQLQKILYFTWMDYYEAYRIRLFEDRHFEAWKYGPVVGDVYYEYWLNVSRLIFITKEPGSDMSKVSDFLLKSLETFHVKSAKELMKMVHEPSSPWDVSYEEGEKREIPFPLMESSALMSENRTNGSDIV